VTTLVLVHGITESKASWDPLVEPLSAIAPVRAVDLRGHGGAIDDAPYDLVTMATDVFAEMSAAGIDASDAVLIGHSLGGTVVSAMAATVPVKGVINVDQSLALGSFQEGLRQLEPMLRGDTASFEQAISMVFDSMRGPLSTDETARIEALRQPRQHVVLGVWAPVLESSAEELDGLVAAMAGGITSPYLSLHGIDPGDGYTAWVAELVPTATVEVWTDHGHYPHLVDPARFVDRVREFVDST
jgi:pimeloyl-ACP methyl ester carboxylesterase